MPTLRLTNEEIRDYICKTDSSSFSNEETGSEVDMLTDWCEKNTGFKITKQDHEVDRWTIEGSMNGNEVYIAIDIEDASIASIYFDDERDYPEIEKWLKKMEEGKNIQEIIQGLWKYNYLSEKRKDLVEKLQLNHSVFVHPDKKTGWKLDFGGKDDPTYTVNWIIGPMKQNPYALTHCLNVDQAEESDAAWIQTEEDEDVLNLLVSLAEAES